MLNFLNGTATAMITPFGKDGKVNFAALAKMIDFQIENGTDMLIVLGTTGEPATMTEGEKEEVWFHSLEMVKGRAKVVFGTGSNNTAHAVELSQKAEALGADGLLVVTPYYNKCTQNGIYEYYKTVANAVHIPIICYNVPPRTGVNILPATMEKIASIDNIAGIKEACGADLRNDAPHPRKMRPVLGRRQSQPSHPCHRRNGVDLRCVQYHTQRDEGAV